MGTAARGCFVKRESASSCSLRRAFLASRRLRQRAWIACADRGEQLAWTVLRDRVDESGEGVGWRAVVRLARRSSSRSTGSTTPSSPGAFTPDGLVLFVNIFADGPPGSGMTAAVAGPWHRGPL